MMQAVDFHSYYPYEALTAFLQETVATAPRLARLESLLTSASGREMWAVTVGDADKGPPLDERPACLVYANIHATELAGAQVCLHILAHLVGDAEARALLRSHTFYVIPRVAVDGAEHVLTTWQHVRSHPLCLPRPNAVIPGDIDGDGKILTMRWRDGTGAEQTAAEGLIHEYDPSRPIISEPKIDFNRNFPAGWRPRTGIREGRYPLCYAEPRALAECILAHPNICLALSIHTGTRAILVPPADPATVTFVGEDAARFAALARAGSEWIGFPVRSFFDYAGQKAGPGTTLDWLYEHLGLYEFGVELGMNKRAPEGPENSVPWRPFRHPQLGPVEIGGWIPQVRANPTPAETAQSARDCAAFALYLARQAPRLVIERAAAAPAGEGRYRVEVAYRNDGGLPTSVTDKARELPRPGGIEITVEGAGGPRREARPHLAAGAADRAELTIRGEPGSRLTVTVRGERAGSCVKVVEVP